MASNTLNCHLCHKAMEDDEASIKHHLSSFHVKYWPYSCTTCDEKGSIHKEATEEAMEEHIATFHGESNLGYYVPKKTEKDKKKETELKTAIAQCRRFSTFQITSTNPTNTLHQNLNFIHNGTTGSENDIGNEQILNNSNDNLRQVSISASSITAVDTPIENELVPIGVKYEGFYYAIPSEVNANDGAIAHEHSDCSIQFPNNELLDQQHCAVNSPENVTESEPPMPPVSLSEPTMTLETKVLNERFVDAVNSCEHNTALNAEILTKPEPSPDISTVALGLQTALSSFVSTDVDANKGQLDSAAKNTFCEPSISHKKRTHLDVAFTDASARKRSTQNLTTSAEVPVDAPTDPAQKMKIKKIRIGLRSGNASFETSQGQCHAFRSLSGYMSILRQSEADVLGCDAYIRYQTPRNTKAGKVVTHAKSVIATRQKFENFSKEMHSISHLWANGRVEADLWEYSKHANEVVPVSNFCDEFFSQDRSILACKELEIRIDNSWPFSVVTNIANHCNKLVFEEFKYSVPDQRLHYHFLDAIYEMKLPQHIVFTLKLHFSESGKQFIDELKKRFERSTGQCFKVQLLSKREISKYNKHERSVRNSEIPNMVLLNDYGTLETKTLPYNSHHHDNVMIEQRPFLIG
ncbi:hypothetical protein Ddc_13049 [Ditylenchus destructor]|nr:hypothetical protein Ddc_13049 [Ditylenchus destructor]